MENNTRATAGSRRKPPKYDQLTQAFAAWLFAPENPKKSEKKPRTHDPVARPGLIDRYDWGYWHPRERVPVYAATTDFLNRWRNGTGRPAARITRTHLQLHLHGKEKVYYTSRRGSGFVLPMIDVDAHDGQTDAPETVGFIVQKYFPGASGIGMPK